MTILSEEIYNLCFFGLKYRRTNCAFYRRYKKMQGLNSRDFPFVGCLRGNGGNRISNRNSYEKDELSGIPLTDLAKGFAFIVSTQTDRFSECFYVSPFLTGGYVELDNNVFFA